MIKLRFISVFRGFCGRINDQLKVVFSFLKALGPGPMTNLRFSDVVEVFGTRIDEKVLWPVSLTIDLFFKVCSKFVKSLFVQFLWRPHI